LGLGLGPTTTRGGTRRGGGGGGALDRGLTHQGLFHGIQRASRMPRCHGGVSNSKGATCLWRGGEGVEKQLENALKQNC
jgi:hypothetical protein